MEKIFINNRAGKKIAVLIEVAPKARGLAFVMHGQGSVKEQPQIETFAAAFRDNDFTVIRFDARNSMGESEGKMEDASITSYYEDLEDVIDWSRTQHWYREPFVLAGHSLGGICIALYAERHPEKVRACAPTSTVVSGTLSYEAHMAADPKGLEEWRRTGWQVSESRSHPGVIKRIKWANMEDRLKYDLLEGAQRLTMPVLMMVGEKDTGTPLEHQKILYDRLPGRKELHLIKGAEHTFRDEKHLQEISAIFDQWIKSFTMRLVATIRDADVGSDFPNPIVYKERRASRAIVFDEDRNVALLHARKKHYHKLPGGGIEKGESVMSALHRELSEEIGCSARNIRELGIVEEYRNKYSLRQISYCFLADVDGEKGTPHLEADEIADGFETIWIGIGSAIVMLEGEASVEDYEGKFIRMRDLALLKEAVQSIHRTSIEDEKDH